MIATACRNRTRLIEHSPRRQKGNCVITVSLIFMFFNKGFDKNTGKYDPENRFNGSEKNKKSSQFHLY